MTHGGTARTTGRIRIRWIRVAGLLLFCAVVAGALDQWPGSPSSTAAPRIHVLRGAHPGAHREPAALGEADGAIPPGTTVFSDDVPGVAKLDPALLAALRRAATDAGNAGVRFLVDSGWRSRGYQAHLLQDAVAKYGSEAEAARWVATPGRSAHVSGDAVDLGPSDATAWLSAHGSAYGLCRIYANESWHFELRPEAAEQGCPPMYADAAHDPRMQG